jgi:hypothetical protein
MIKIERYILQYLSLIIISFSCTSSSQKADDDRNIEVVREYHEIWSNGKIEELDRIVAPNFQGRFIGGFEYDGIDVAKN